MAKRSKPEANTDEWVAEVEKDNVADLIGEESNKGKEELTAGIVTAKATVLVSREGDTALGD